MSPLTESVLSYLVFFILITTIILDIKNCIKNKINYYYVNGQFLFNIKKDKQGYKIYIDKHPSYGNRNQSLALTHRHFDGKRYYICWTGNITSSTDAEAIANDWSKKTIEYIKTGKNF